MQNIDLLKVYHFDKKFRLGANCDGGYVVGELEGGYDCYISAGICDEESFSRDFINKYGMNRSNSFGFDGTIHDYPYEYTRDITFYKKNINWYNDDYNTNLDFLLEKYNNIFIKMDIEGGEYPWLYTIDEKYLKNIKQLVLELHGLTNDGWDCPNKEKMKCLEKLNRSHYIIHAHGNNYGPVVNNFPDVIELTYINKNCFDREPSLNKTPLPIPNIDFSNDNNLADIDLNYYPFVQ